MTIKTNGVCNLCRKSFSQSGISKHIETHLQEQENASSGSAAKEYFHIRVADKYMKFYWLELLVEAKLTLGDLDSFLRDIWLECCGHMSSFEIKGERFDSFEDDFFSSGPKSKHNKGFETRLDKILHEETVVDYTYDFGSSTYLTLKVISRRKLAGHTAEIELIARNIQPEPECNVCKKKPATQIFTDYSETGENLFCDTCAKKHIKKYDDEEMFLPFVNSPRTGVCAYTGE